MKYASFSQVQDMHVSITEASYFPTNEKSPHTRALMAHLMRAVEEDWYVGVDTEFDSDDLDRCNAHRTQPEVISIAIPTDLWFNGYRVCQPYVFTGTGKDLLRNWFAGRKPKRVAHMANVDRHIIENWNGVPVPHMVDTFTTARFIDPTADSLGLKDLAWCHLQYGWSKDYKALWGNAKASSMINNPRFLSYAQVDAAWAAELHQYFMLLLKERGEKTP